MGDSMGADVCLCGCGDCAGCRGYEISGPLLMGKVVGSTSGLVVTWWG